MVDIKLVSLKDFSVEIELQRVSSYVEIGVNFMQIYHVDFNVLSCIIRGSNYNGRY